MGSICILGKMSGVKIDKISIELLMEHSGCCRKDAILSLIRNKNNPNYTQYLKYEDVNFYNCVQYRF